MKRATKVERRCIAQVDVHRCELKAGHLGVHCATDVERRATYTWRENTTRTPRTRKAKRHG